MKRRMLLGLIVIMSQTPTVGVAGGALLSAVDTSCPVLPAENIWNARVDNLPVHSRSAEYVSSIGNSATLHPDFGSGVWPPGSNSPLGIPYIEVGAAQPWVTVNLGAYADESDPGPHPIPSNAPIEGGPDSSGDRHVLVIDVDNCVLYELANAYPAGGGAWNASVAARFDLTSNSLRPETWTSADAAGLPIFPGLVRYDEVASGRIDHAIRFTAAVTQRAYVWPARHYASSNTSLNVPPMGQRFRLKSTFDVSGFSPQIQVILTAFKEYGIILADNGSNWFISGSPDSRWDNDILHQLKSIPGSAFEAVDVSGLMVNPNSGATASPTPPCPPGEICDVAAFQDSGGQFHLLSELTWNHTKASFYFGNPGDVAFSGDWDCDGVDTPGLYRRSDGYVYLRNSNTQGIADISFFFGNPGDYPIAGDFNGDGCDSVSIYRPSEARFYVINQLGSNDGGLGEADFSFLFGDFGDKPFVGDFDGNGIAGIGLHRESTGLVYFRNSLSTGIADSQFIYGNPGDKLLAGDWNGNGRDSVAVYRPSNGMLYLKFENTQGVADLSFAVGSGYSGAVTIGLNLPSGSP